MTYIPYAIIVYHGLINYLHLLYYIFIVVYIICLQHNIVRYTLATLTAKI